MSDVSLDPRFAETDALVVDGVPLGHYRSFDGRKFYHVWQSDDGYKAVWGLGKAIMGSHDFDSPEQAARVLKEKVMKGYAFREGYQTHVGHRWREEVRAAELDETLPVPAPARVKGPRF